MPRRSKRKQVKKAEPSEDVPAEEIDTSAQEEAPVSEEAATEQSDQGEESEEKMATEDVSLPEETESCEVSEQQQEGKEHAEEETDVDSATALTEDEAPVVGEESQTDESQGTESSSDQKEDDLVEAPKSEESESEPMQTEDVVRQSGDATQETLMEEPEQQTEKQSADEPEDAEMAEPQELEEDVSYIKIEKEPTVPYCYDDDKEPVAIDPEGDEGEVLIGNESAEFLKYWRAVLDNPHDFTNWTYLLQVVEQENKPSLTRRAYNGFFKRYPLCYGYWKKFSERERRNGNLVRAQRILERGVRAIPLSIDLWVHTIDFYINFYKGPDAGREKIKKIFERAVAASGEEFRSEKLWNKYLKWEMESKDWKMVMVLYDRMIKLPTQHYAVYFKELKEFVMSRAPSEILEVEEFEKLLEEVRDDAEKKEMEKKKKKKEEKKEKEAKAKEKEETDAHPPTPSDDDPPGVESNDRGKPPNDKEIKSISEKIVSKKKRIFEDTEAHVTKIWTFEEGIKRPYFHVKALERTQIKNWRDYLEAEMNRGDENHARVVLLFERCLIACALYEDFWLKYARYLVKTDPPATRNVFQRACEIHLPKKPNIHMHWASFEELQGNYEAAARIFVNLENTLPNLAMVKLRRVAVERRAGHIKEAEDLLTEYIANAANGEECFYIRKYAWFLVKVSKKLDVARQVLKDAIVKYKDQVQLYKDLIGLEFSHGDEESFTAACDIALETEGLSDDTKFLFSQRKLEYMEDFGTDGKMVQKAYDDHQKLYRSHKKRQHGSLDSSLSTAKKAKTDATSPSKIQTTGAARQTYSAKPTTNGSYANQVTVSAQPQPAAQIQPTAQTYQAAATDPTSLYYQNYWNYQKPAEAQQYQYSQWPQYSQQGYYQQ